MPKLIDSPPAESTQPVRVEVPKPTAPSKQTGDRIVLADLEVELEVLEGAFGELEKLKTAEARLAGELEECAKEENQIIRDGSLPEKAATQKLLEVRARRDLRAARLAEAHKKIVLQIDLIIFDIGESLRGRFVNFSHQLFVTRESELRQIVLKLFPNGGGLPLSPEQLLAAAAPLTPFRQISNWTKIEFPQDPAEHLEQLRDLPGRWLSELRVIVAQEQSI
jgi:hypothetical protein